MPLVVLAVVDDGLRPLSPRRGRFAAPAGVSLALEDDLEQS